jgi:hypothetical protein
MEWSRTDMNDTPKEEPNEGAAPGDLNEELRRAGEKLAQVINAAVQSRQGRQILADIESGMGELATGLRHGFEHLSQTEEGQNLHQSAQQAWEKARQAGDRARHEAEPQLVQGIKELNLGLQRLIDYLEEKGAPPPQQGQG